MFKTETQILTAVILLGDLDVTLADDVEGVAARALADDVLAAVEQGLKIAIIFQQSRIFRLVHLVL